LQRFRRHDGIPANPRRAQDTRYIQSDISVSLILCLFHLGWLGVTFDAAL
jgi:hypothetical protein